MLRNNKRGKCLGMVISTLLIVSTILVAGEILGNGNGSPQEYIVAREIFENYFAEAITKGDDDNTGQPLENIQTDDDMYYRVQGTCIGGDLLFLDGFNVSGMAGSITSVILHVQYLMYTTYDREGCIRWALDNGSLHNTTIQPHQTNIEVNESYDLFTQGVNTPAEIESLDIEFSNPGGWIIAPAIYFDYIWIEVGFEVNNDD